jgi:hypothetical protein
MATYIPNFPAPERVYGQYTGPTYLQWSGGTVGMQPQGPNNPAGQIPGVLQVLLRNVERCVLLVKLQLPQKTVNLPNAFYSLPLVSISFEDAV